MNPFQAIAKLREELRARIDMRAASLIRFAQTTTNTASGDGDAVAGHETDEEAGEPTYQYLTRRLWPFGIRSRPPTGIDSVAVHVFGGSINAVMLGAESPEYGPSDLEEGEVAIYAKASGAVIKIDVDGNITIDASASKNITVAATGTGVVQVTAAPVTGTVKLGPVGNLQVLVQGTLDSMGVPVTQAPAATLSIVKAG